MLIITHLGSVNLRLLQTTPPLRAHAFVLMHLFNLTSAMALNGCTLPCLGSLVPEQKESECKGRVW
jgi:hypothetical protein